jgi:hypothetical protein
MITNVNRTIYQPPMNLIATRRYRNTDVGNPGGGY